MRKKILGLMLSVVMMSNICGVQTHAKAYYGGADSYSCSWTERSGFLWLTKDKYSASAKYSKSFIVLLENLSGTKYWDNYKNAKKTAQRMEIGISKSTTVSKTESYQVSAQVGLKVPVKASEVSGQIGGSYTNQKTYAKTVGTSSAYEINTNSKNGYYAVTHAANCDAYQVVVKKNGSKIGDGELIRYSSKNGYERLWYSASDF